MLCVWILLDPSKYMTGIEMTKRKTINKIILTSLLNKLKDDLLVDVHY